MMTLPVRRRPTRFCWIETPGCFSVNMPGLRFQPGGSPAEEAPRSLEDEWYESEKQEQAQTRQQFWFYYHNQHRLSWTPRFSCFPSQLLWLIRFRVSNFVHAASKTDPNPIFSLRIWICFVSDTQLTESDIFKSDGNESDTYQIVLNATMVWTARSHLMWLCSLF